MALRPRSTLRLPQASLVAPALVMVLVVATACTGNPPAGSGASLSPPSCPFDDVVMLDGDSLGAGYAAQMQLPGWPLFSSAVGGSSFTQIGTLETIDNRVLRWIDQCGAPEVLVVEGGINDLLNGVAVGDLISEVTALRDELAARGVTTRWVTIPPLASPGGYASLNPMRRAYNDWLKSADGVGDAVIDVVPAMEDPANPDTLAPAYWWYWADLFKPDGIHPNTAGYQAMAQAVAAALEAQLGE